MNSRIFNFYAVAIIIAAAFFISSKKEANDVVYALTDMSWAEFYAGELGSTVAELEAKGYDAVTSATMVRSKMFQNSIVSEDGSRISGIKNVPVMMSEAVYKSLSSDEKARFTLLDTKPSNYKAMNKKGAFGPLVTKVKKVEGASATISSGEHSRWGNYTIRISNLQLEGQYLGVILKTSDGALYGLKSLDNVWLRATEIGLCVEEYIIKGVNKPGYKHTADLRGKTITNVTYLMTEGDALSVDMKLLCE